MEAVTLGREVIVGEALALLREGRIADVSLRKIAARLGVKAPSLYWHIGSKQALYALMSEAILRAALEAMPHCDDWRDWLRAFGRVFWRIQHDYPDGRQLSVLTTLDESVRQEVHGFILARLGALGMAPEKAAIAQRSVLAIVIGWTILKQTPGSASGEDEANFNAALEILIAGWSASDPAGR